MNQLPRDTQKPISFVFWVVGILSWAVLLFPGSLLLLALIAAIQPEPGDAMIGAYMIALYTIVISLAVLLFDFIILAAFSRGNDWKVKALILSPPLFGILASAFIFSR